MPSAPSRLLAVAAACTLGCAVLAAAGPAAAQTTLFYNGDPDYYNGWTNEQLAVAPGFTVDARIYDNFTITGTPWTVTALLATMQGRRVGSIGPSNVTWSSAYWEIRSGITPGNGGTLLHSGTNATTLTLLATPSHNANTYRTVVGGFTPFTLGPGTYWMTVSPYPTGEADPMAGIWTTGGANGVNAQIDGEMYSDSPTFGTNFARLDAWPNDAFSYGVIGTTAAPEPATLALTALGLGGLAVVARRRRRAIA